MSQRESVRQRTALAWGRTALASGGFAAAMLRLGAVRHSIPDLVAAIGLSLCGLFFALRGRVLYYRPAEPAAAPLRLVTLIVVITGVAIAVTAGLAS